MCRLEEMKKMNDVELLKIYNNSKSKEDKNDAMATLWLRYQHQVHNNWWKLRRQMNGSDAVLSLRDEYYSEAHEVFITAIQKIELDRIENDNFKCVGMINWYLTNLRTKMIKTVCTTVAQTKSLSMMNSIDDDEVMTTDVDVEEAYWESEGYQYEPSYVVEKAEVQQLYERIILECKKKWTTLEVELFEKMLEGKKKAEIIESMKIESNTYSSSIRRIKKDLVKAKKRLCG